MALSTEQYLLLNNLLYTFNTKAYPDPDKAPIMQCDTVKDLYNYINTNAEVFSGEYYMDTEDWNGIASALEKDDALMRMEIKATRYDAPEGGLSAVFVDNSTKEAVVVFKGTEGKTEWLDNFAGGNMTDTPCQTNALNTFKDLYQECGLEDYHVTVSGHSKGGNKAKYIAILAEAGMVDQCVSFDGQGFSDKFFEKYAEQIAKNQHLIQNHNVDSDFVNILLNDIGTTQYYVGQELGTGENGNAFLENHCPNSFFTIDADGNVTMTKGKQSELMRRADGMFNSFLRSLPEEGKDVFLSVMGCLVTGIVCHESADYIFSVLFSPETVPFLARFVSYAIEYSCLDVLHDLIGKTGQQWMGPYLDKIVHVFGILDNLPIHILNRGFTAVALFLVNVLHVDLPIELIIALLNQSKTFPDGSDLRVADAKAYRIKINSGSLESACSMLADAARAVDEIKNTVEGIQLTGTFRVRFHKRISSSKKILADEAAQLQRLQKALDEISRAYTATEKSMLQ